MTSETNEHTGVRPETDERDRSLQSEIERLESELSSARSELQLEAALDRVLTKAMTMESSDDIGETTLLMFDELKAFLPDILRAGVLVITPPDTLQSWLAGLDSDGKRVLLQGYEFQREARVEIGWMLDAWAEGKHLTFLESQAFLEYVLEHGYQGDASRIVPVDAPHDQYFSQFNNKSGCVFVAAGHPVEVDSAEGRVVARFSSTYDLAYRRYLDLREAEERTREARIEAALERVRGRAMAMHSSTEMSDVAAVMCEQATLLEFPYLRRILVFVVDDDPEFVWMYGSSQEGDSGVQGIRFRLDAHEHFVNLGGTDHGVPQRTVSVFEGESMVRLMKILFDAGWVYPGGETTTEKFLTNNSAFKKGSISAITYEPIGDEAFYVLDRFAQAFDLAYQRFEDLSKAEAQAREAKIEAALERVRGRAMAMHASEEISAVATVMFEELKELDIAGLRQCHIHIMDLESRTFAVSSSSTSVVPITDVLLLPMDVNDAVCKITAPWEAGHSRYSVEFAGKEMLSLMRHVIKYGWDYTRGDERAEFFIMNFARFSHGVINAATNEPLSESGFDILERFAQTFDLAYTRYEDLKNAEKRAREAEIEAALERVRSRSMAMHHSDEMSDVMASVFSEMTNLGITQPGDRAFIADIISDDPPSARIWLTSKGGERMSGSFVIPDMNVHEGFRELYDGVKRGVEYYAVRYEGDLLRSFSEAHAAIPGFVELVTDSIAAQGHEGLPEGLTWVHAPFSNGDLGLVIERPELTPESQAICVRFSKVFDQSYRRFLDLQDSERRAIEVRKQASVDRIRAEIATMRTAEDLERITPLIWKELETQEIPFLRCGLLIVSEEEHVARFYLSRPDGRPLAALELPFGSSNVADAATSAWRKDEVWKQVWDREKFVSWTQEMMQAGQIERPEQYYGGETPPDSIALHFVPFQQGMIYVGAPDELSESDLESVEALAQAFAVAYSRYDDFRTTENALKELRFTQRQLIEQEKLASLGSLTAGIAHEIKNPLNFVNNFAEVSAELAQELSEAVANGETAEVQTILDDLILNATQITKHGKRADSIVRSMMQHARGGTSERESIDVNEFIEEYVNLAWHGMRARDHGFQAEVIRNYGDDIGSISVLPQEIGRVLLNLLNNAFYAVASDDRPGTEQLVTVSTSRTDGSVEVTVADNGPGIPADVRQRIFEPFFTTKPTGEGTGLGLSLSYDIVTKGHGGEMTVGESTEGGAEFRIVLPV